MILSNPIPDLGLGDLGLDCHPMHPTSMNSFGIGAMHFKLFVCSVIQGSNCGDHVFFAMASVCLIELPELMLGHEGVSR
jgi:hypothetical protein